MVYQTIFQSPLFIQLLLPFILVFTVIFAILQKSKILGDGKTQIDAIVSLVVGLIVVAFGNIVNLIVNLIPFLAVSVIIILVFLIIWGTVNDGPMKFDKGVKIAAGIVALIAVIIVVLYLTPAWAYIISLFHGGGNSTVVGNVAMVIIVIIAIAAVIVGAGKPGKKEEAK